jgi:hypothetical protein
MAGTRAVKPKKEDAVSRAEAESAFRLEWCQFLCDAIALQVPDDAKTQFGQDTVLKSPWTETEADVLKGKLFYLMRHIPVFDPDKHGLKL